MSEFQVLVRLQIHGSFSAASTEDVWLERRFTLPFPPFNDLTITIGEWDCTLTEVSWDADKGEFRCYVKSDKQIYNACLPGRELPEAQRPQMAEIVKDYLSDGWCSCDSPENANTKT